MSFDSMVAEVLDALKALPPEKVGEVRDFALFLRERQAKLLKEVQWDWSEEDLRDFSTYVSVREELENPWKE